MKHATLKSVFLAAAISLIGKAAIACDTNLSPGNDIQAALNSSSSTVVCLATGTYVVSSNIVIPAGKSLLGADQYTTVISTNASRGVELQAGATLGNLSINGTNPNNVEYAVMVYNANNTTVWSVRSKYSLIGVGVIGSSNVQVLNNAISNTGIPGDGIASPSIYVDGSNSVTIRYGEIFGSFENGYGDGEVAAHNSNYVTIDSLYVNRSGAAGIYMVNCDYCRVENSFIRYAGEHGLDIVGGSDYFIARNNEVTDHRWGGAIFDQRVNLGGEFTNNNFTTGRFSPPGAECMGVSVLGNMNVPLISGNTPTGGRFPYVQKCSL